MLKGRFATCTILLALLTLSVFKIANLSMVARAQATPNVYINPKVTTAQMNSTFSVNVTVAGVTDLCSWQVYIYFETSVVNAVEYVEGSFLNSHGATMFDGQINNSYNNTHGELWMWCIRMWAGTGVDGNGTLATVKFQTKLGGTTPLSLTNTILGNSTAQPINHTTTDGTVDTGSHDLAITGLVHYRTIVGRGQAEPINVTVADRGTYTETFNITAYANSTILQTKTITNLANGTSTTVSFSWDTTGFAYGNYTVWAYVWPVPGQTNTSNNTFRAYTPIEVTIPGDVDGNHVVNILDVVKITSIYGVKRGSPSFNPNCDIENIGQITILDVVACTSHYGQKWS